MTKDLDDKKVADGGSEKWVLAYDCSYECDKRTGCTGYEYRIKDDGKQNCLTYTAPKSKLVKDNQQKTNWASCINKQGIGEMN